MNGAEFWRRIDDVATRSVKGYTPFGAKATNINSNGVQIKQLGSDVAGTQRYKKLRNAKINANDDVAVIPYEGSNLILGAVGGADDLVNISDVTGLQTALDGKNKNIYAVTDDGGGNVTELTWLDGFYQGVDSGIDARASSWNPNQLQMNVRWGMGFSQVPRGSHSHSYPTLPNVSYTLERIYTGPTLQVNIPNYTYATLFEQTDMYHGGDPSSDGAIMTDLSMACYGGAGTTANFQVGVTIGGLPEVLYGPYQADNGVDQCVVVHAKRTLTLASSNNPVTIRYRIYMHSGVLDIRSFSARHWSIRGAWKTD